MRSFRVIVATIRHRERMGEGNYMKISGEQVAEEEEGEGGR